MTNWNKATSHERWASVAHSLALSFVRSHRHLHSLQRERHPQKHGRNESSIHRENRQILGLPNCSLKQLYLSCFSLLRPLSRHVFGTPDRHLQMSLQIAMCAFVTVLTEVRSEVAATSAAFLMGPIPQSYLLGEGEYIFCGRKKNLDCISHGFMDARGRQKLQEYLHFPNIFATFQFLPVASLSLFGGLHTSCSSPNWLHYSVQPS